MTTNRDMVQLKLQKLLLKEKIDVTNGKLERLTTILHKKHSGMTRRPFDETTTTSDGLTVNDFRIQNYAPKLLPPLHSRPDAQPCPDTNELILSIRNNHLLKTVGRQEVVRQTKEKEAQQAKREMKKKTRSFPSISIPKSFLPNRYLRGELPCTIEHGANGHYLSWACPLENLDYEYYLPLFFDGLQCKEQPICFLACQGIEDMLFACKGTPERVVACIKSIVRPLRNALSKFDVEILLYTLKSIQQLLQCGDSVGAALLPHAKQFLAPMAAFLDCERNIGDSIDYGQRKSDDVGEEVRITLEMMEERGGPTAFTMIKFCIPLCEYFLFHSFVLYLFFIGFSFCCVCCLQINLA